VIPAAILAIQELTQFNVPYVFVSNTCMLESEKAKQLSEMLGVLVSNDDKILFLFNTKLFDCI
jgi:ribonucleotide monophosphatase NagD (HAD superfamily)